MNEDDFRNAIDNYESSIHAIVGFANFYLWDDARRRMRKDVCVFQGRRLRPAQEKDPEAGEQEILGDACVTPDLGVLCDPDTAVLAEVKLSFPRDQSRWMDDFVQLMKYDADLIGWPNDAGKVASHDVVLITDQGRAGTVRKFYEKHRGFQISFTRPFALIACNRSDNRQPFYFFRTETGNLSRSDLDARLDDGVKVPMKVLLRKYSTIRLYDAEPPLPHMMELIWTHVVVDDARQKTKFSKLRKNQKLPVELEVDEIVTRLRDGFTFRTVEAHASDGTPSVPKRPWVTKALEQFVLMKMAEWLDFQKTRIRIDFQRQDDILGHFIKGCAGGESAVKQDGDRQLRLDFDA